MCNVAYAHLVAGLDDKQRGQFDDNLSHDPAFERRAAAAMSTILGEGG